MHDIGKVGIPDSILLKPGRLTEEEFEVMKTHTLMGGETLRAAAEKHPGHSYLKMACDIAMTHHEKFDGSGYPNKLAGMEIPLCGRIVAIADVYDALTSKRVYKDAYSHEKACNIIRCESGSHFDPEIAKVFLENADKFNEIRLSFADRDPQEETPETPANESTAVVVAPVVRGYAARSISKNMTL